MSCHLRVYNVIIGGASALEACIETKCGSEKPCHFRLFLRFSVLGILQDDIFAALAVCP